MQPSAKLLKTAKGLEEIDKRIYKLSGRLRAVMFMIDGQRTVEALLDQAGSMAEQLEAQLDELLVLGFIEEVVPNEVVAEPQVSVYAALGGKSSVEPTSKPTEIGVGGAKQYLSVAPTGPAVAPKIVPEATEASAFNKPAAKAQLEPVDVIKSKLNKMLAETMGMRAMFITAELNGFQTHSEIERFIDDTARSMATSNGADAATKWREQARILVKLS